MGDFKKEISSIVDLLESVDRMTADENVESLKSTIELLERQKESMFIEMSACKKQLAELYKFPKQIIDKLVGDETFIPVPMSFSKDRKGVMILSDPICGPFKDFGLISPEDAFEFFQFKERAKLFIDVVDLHAELTSGKMDVVDFSDKVSSIVKKWNESR